MKEDEKDEQRGLTERDLLDIMEDILSLPTEDRQWACDLFNVAG